MLVMILKGWSVGDGDIGSYSQLDGIRKGSVGKSLLYHDHFEAGSRKVAETSSAFSADYPAVQNKTKS